MSVLEPLNLTKIDLKNILFKRPVIVDNKKVIYLKYNKDNKITNFVIQLSKIINNTIISTEEVEFEITNINDKKFINDLDDYIISEAKLNKLWFNSVHNIEYIRILQDNNTIKLKLVNDNNLKTIVSLNNSDINNFDEIKTSDTISKVILEFYAILIDGININLLVRPINILLKYNEILNYNYKFFEDSDIINSDIINLDTENSSDINTEKIFLKSTMLDNDYNIDYLTSSIN